MCIISKQAHKLVEIYVSQWGSGLLIVVVYRTAKIDIFFQIEGACESTGRAEDLSHKYPSFAAAVANECLNRRHV